MLHVHYCFFINTCTCTCINVVLTDQMRGSRVGSLQAIYSQLVDYPSHSMKLLSDGAGI